MSVNDTLRSDVVLNVYSLLNPSTKVLLNLENSLEEAALISRAYTLTGNLERKGRLGPRRPLPSVEPERTMYKNLRPWKKLAVPNYVVVVENETSSLIGAPVLFWDGKKSLQGAMPWGRPVVGTISGQEADYWTVIVDPVAMATAQQQLATRHAKAILKATPPPVEVQTVMVPAPPPPPVVAAPEPEPVAVEGTAVEEDKIDFDYTGDPFTLRQDGHFVGDDGFVVPMNFDEFYERYPKYVLNWVKKRLNRFIVDEDVEDWTQDLLIHMKWLPQASKHRTPGANGRTLGCSDVIETFNPYQQYGASERRFRNYINFCLANKFNTVQSKRQKNPVCRPGNLPFGMTPEEEQQDRGGISGEELVHQHSHVLAAKSEQVQKQHDDRLFTNQFKTYVRKEDPSVFPAIEALEACGPMGEAAEYMGVTEQEFARYRSRLKQLAECFLKNQPVPRQRKPYKKRATTA